MPPKAASRVAPGIIIASGCDRAGGGEGQVFMGASRSESGHPHHRRLSVSLGRAFGGALVFSLPMLMTMEMWELGAVIDRWRLLGLMALSWPLFMFISHYSGFEETWDWQEDARDVAIAFGVGVATSALILSLLAIIEPGQSVSEILGAIGLQTIPAALGALLARSQFSAHDGSSDEDDKSESYGGELAVMTAGALFLNLNLAPTEEMLLISYRMSAFHCFLLVPLSMLIMHGFVYAAAFKGGSDYGPDTPWWTVFLKFTVVGYVIALEVVVVLGFPAAVGAAAARLIL